MDERALARRSAVSDVRGGSGVANANGGGGESDGRPSEERCLIIGN